MKARDKEKPGKWEWRGKKGHNHDHEHTHEHGHGHEHQHANNVYGVAAQEQEQYHEHEEEHNQSHGHDLSGGHDHSGPHYGLGQNLPRVYGYQAQEEEFIEEEVTEKPETKPKMSFKEAMQKQMQKYPNLMENVAKQQAEIDHFQDSDFRDKKGMYSIDEMVQKSQIRKELNNLREQGDPTIEKLDNGAKLDFNPMDEENISKLKDSVAKELEGIKQEEFVLHEPPTEEERKILHEGLDEMMQSPEWRKKLENLSSINELIIKKTNDMWLEDDYRFVRFYVNERKAQQGWLIENTSPDWQSFEDEKFKREVINHKPTPLERAREHEVLKDLMKRYEKEEKKQRKWGHDRYAPGAKTTESWVLEKEIYDITSRQTWQDGFKNWYYYHKRNVSECFGNFKECFTNLRHKWNGIWIRNYDPDKYQTYGFKQSWGTSIKEMWDSLRNKIALN